MDCASYDQHQNTTSTASSQGRLGYPPTDHPWHRIVHKKLIRFIQIAHHDTIGDQQDEKTEETQQIDGKDVDTRYVVLENVARLVSTA